MSRNYFQELSKLHTTLANGNRVQHTTFFKECIDSLKINFFLSDDKAQNAYGQVFNQAISEACKNNKNIMQLFKRLTDIDLDRTITEVFINGQHQIIQENSPKAKVLDNAYTTYNEIKGVLTREQYGTPSPVVQILKKTENNLFTKFLEDIIKIYKNSVLESRKTTRLIGGLFNFLPKNAQISEGSLANVINGKTPAEIIANLVNRSKAAWENGNKDSASTRTLATAIEHGIVSKEFVTKQFDQNKTPDLITSATARTASAALEIEAKEENEDHFRFG